MFFVKSSTVHYGMPANTHTHPMKSHQDVQQDPCSTALHYHFTFPDMQYHSTINAEYLFNTLSVECHTVGPTLRVSNLHCKIDGT